MKIARSNKPAIAIFYNLLVIFTFFIIYYLIQNQFENRVKKTTSIDIANLAITLQTSAGYTNLIPVSKLANSLVAIQQMLLIFGNLIILHI